MSQAKRFKRDYLLNVGVGGQAVTVAPPFRISFDATKSMTGNLNTLNVNIYGLKASTKQQLIKEFGPGYIPISLEVGYVGGRELVFKGSIHIGEITRSGPDVYNVIQAKDGGTDFIQSFTNATVNSKEQAIDAIIADMPNTTKGKITALGELLRPKVLLGPSADLIPGLVGQGDNYFIDNEQLNILKPDEVVSSFAPLVASSTGLLNTPSIDKARITFQTWMNPVIRVGGLANVQSVNSPYLNGLYRIETIKYTGDYEGADWSMTCTGTRVTNFKVI